MKIRFLNQKFILSEIWKLRFSIFKLLFEHKKISNFLAVSASKILKKSRVLGSPLMLMIEPSSRCDMVCTMCPVILNKTNRKKGDMTFDTFKKLIDEIGDRLLFLSLWNYGEPLLNPDIFLMINYARKKSIITLMSTNGLSLSEEKINKLLDSGLDYLIFSFDGATQETYEKFRGKGNFDKVLANLTLLMKMKKEQKKPLPFVDVQFIVMKENEHEIELVRKLSKKIGVDKLSLKKFTYVGGEEASPFLTTKSKYLFGKYKGLDNSGGCLRVADSSVILWDGAVVPCCGDLDFRYVFGNINSDKKFMDIWNDTKYRTFRKEVFLDTKPIKMCNRCPSKNYNLDMFIQ